MAKSTSQPQGLFSFFDEVEKTEITPKPRRNMLRPPEIVEEVESRTDQTKETIIQNEVVATEPVPEVQSIEEPVVEKVEMVQEAVTEAVVARVEENAPVDESPVVKKVTSTRGRRSVKENSLASEMVELPDDEKLFEKQYYSMGEVTAMFNENHSLIRYWESEFDILKPKKNGKGDRFFRPADVKNLYLIYDLLRRRKFTIDGAREYLKNNKTAEEKFEAVQSLQKIKSFFLELKATL